MRLLIGRLGKELVSCVLNVIIAFNKDTEAPVPIRAHSEGHQSVEVRVFGRGRTHLVGCAFLCVAESTKQEELRVGSTANPTYPLLLRPGALTHGRLLVGATHRPQRHAAALRPLDPCFRLAERGRAFGFWENRFRFFIRRGRTSIRVPNTSEDTERRARTSDKSENVELAHSGGASPTACAG